jgi:hypothetical protein
LRGAVAAAALALGGCGGDGDGDRPRVPPVSSAVSSWAEATEALDQALARCGRQLRPVEGLASACTRSARSDQRAAERDLSDALEAAEEANRSCEDEAEAVATEVARARAAQSRLLRALDALAAGRDPGDTPIIRVEEDARRRTAAALDEARAAAESLDAGC